MSEKKKTLTPVYKYHKSHSYIDVETGEQIKVITQFYSTGLYLIVNGNPSMQFSIDYKDMVRFEKQLIKDEKKGVIKNLKFDILHTVTIENGLYKEI